jgi:hypothetical protein
MQNKINKYVLAQFCASIDMLENAIEFCPKETWNQNKGFSDFWYIAYHTLFFIDFYLTKSPEKFTPFRDFGITELDPEGILPDRVFTKDELKSYVEHCRNKCKITIKGLNENSLNTDYEFGTLKLNFFELVLYNMRHAQHHTAQLNLILRQQLDSAPKWVRRTNKI